MRLTELWQVKCICGAAINSPTPEFTCLKCGRRGICMREDSATGTMPADSTISEREGLR